VVLSDGVSVEPDRNGSCFVAAVLGCQTRLRTERRNQPEGGGIPAAFVG
jgi:hypothetical protein